MIALPADANPNLVLTQIAVSSFVVGLLEWMKKQPWINFVRADTTKVNRAVAFLFACLSAGGIHMAWSHGATVGEYTLGITGLTLANGVHATWEIFRSFMAQQWIFRTAVRPIPLAGHVTIPTKNIVAAIEEPPKGA